MTGMRLCGFKCIILLVWVGMAVWVPRLFSMELVRVETRVDEVVEALGMDGEGVIVAILDRGIDWKNADFRNEDGTTRIKYILDFSVNRTTGTVYTEAQINEALEGGFELGTRDAVGHGTTTTGIAAGNGRNSENGKYRGIAPKASIIAVKVTSDGAPAHGDQLAEASFYDANLVFKGMDFVVAKAAELGMPVVMLPNIGSNGGPTDGTSQFSRKIDEIVGPGKKGVAFLNGPGDEGGAANHAQGTIAAGETASLEVEKAQAGGILVDLWYPTIGAGETGLEFTIEVPSGERFGPYASVANEGARDTRSNVGGSFTYYHNGRDVDFSLSTSQKRQVWISIFGETGTYTIDIKRLDTAATAKEFQATLNFANYAQSPANGFKTYVTPGNIWDGATAFNNISPTNYVLQTSWTDVDGVERDAPASAGEVGAIWSGSSVGPTFDGRLGVDVAAPGEFLITTYAPDSYWATFDFNKVEDGGGFYGRANAVSAAAPIVTGIVALMLQANPELDQLQIREILRKTARADEHTGAVPNPVWGYGKVDAYEAVKAALASSVDVISVSIVISGERPLVRFGSKSGLSYRIEYKNEVDDAEWAVLEEEIEGTGLVVEYLDQSFGDRERRFYRVVKK